MRYLYISHITKYIVRKVLGYNISLKKKKKITNNSESIKSGSVTSLSLLLSFRRTRVKFWRATEIKASLASTNPDNVPYPLLNYSGRPRADSWSCEAQWTHSSALQQASWRTSSAVKMNWLFMIIWLAFDVTKSAYITLHDERNILSSGNFLPSVRHWNTLVSVHNLII